MAGERACMCVSNRVWLYLAMIISEVLGANDSMKVGLHQLLDDLRNG